MLFGAQMSIIISQEVNSAIVTLLDKNWNALSGPVHVRFSLPVYLEHALEEVTVIDNSKCAALPQNKTTVLLIFHVIKEVKGTDTPHQGGSHCTLTLIEIMIPEGLIQRLLLFLLAAEKGMGGGTYLSDMRPDFAYL